MIPTWKCGHATAGPMVGSLLRQSLPDANPRDIGQGHGLAVSRHERASMAAEFGL